LNVLEDGDEGGFLIAMFFDDRVYCLEIYRHRFPSGLPGEGLFAKCLLGMVYELATKQ
jgi:hypothetical protein